MGILYDHSSYEHPNNAPQSHDENDVEVRLVNRSYDDAYCNGPLKIPVDPSEMRVDDITASSSSSSSRDTSFLVSSPSTEYVLNVAFYSFVGFMTVQAIFAYIAKSEAMMADCEAMMVDAVTYLLNLCAEHYKNRPDTPYELSLPLPQRAYRRELQKHCLEFIPPTISVITLILVTIYTLQDSITTLLTIASDQQTSASDKEDEVSIPIMFTFSFANLILDIVNVTCFTRSGFSVMEWMSACRKEKANSQQQEYFERSPLLNSSPKILENYSSGYEDEDVDEQNQATEVNLNMCSAWTHVCADTLRSTAVLIAASIALCIPSSYVHASDIADSVAAMAVSIIILCTLIPLIQGLVRTAGHIVRLLRQRDRHLRPSLSLITITV